MLQQSQGVVDIILVDLRKSRLIADRTFDFRPLEPLRGRQTVQDGDHGMLAIYGDEIQQSQFRNAVCQVFYLGRTRLPASEIDFDFRNRHLHLSKTSSL